jgi:lysophospholipase L1-like esterase
MAARWLARLGLIGLGTVLSILVLELGLRVTHREPWYDRLIGEQVQEPPRYRRNERGLRDRDYGAKPDGTRRILMLGDSFTYGSGVRDEEAVFPRLVEKELQGSFHLADVDDFEVLNGGLPGSLTKAWVRLWNRVGEDFDPDVVLIVFFLRDGTRTSSTKFFTAIRREIVRRNMESRLYAYSYLYRRVRDTLDRQAVSDVYARAIMESYLGSEKQQEEWGLAQENLRWLRDAARGHGATVGLVVFPILMELNDPYPFAPVCDQIEAFARANDIPVLSLLPAFLGQRGPDLWISPFNQHPNAKAHAVAAAAIVPFVERLLQEHERQLAGAR